MAAAVMHPLTRGETMPRAGATARRTLSEADAIIRPNDRLTSFERLEIYNRQYWFRLYSSLKRISLACRRSWAAPDSTP